MPVVKEKMWEALDYPSQELILNEEAIDPTKEIRIDRRGDSFNEKESDLCLRELVGTSNKSEGKKCRISKQCWAFMTSPNRVGYSLTHEILYLQIGEMVSNQKNSV